MKGWGFWAAAILIAVLLIGFHVSDHGENYFEPVADVYLALDAHARDEHCYEGARIHCERERTGYTVRGGTLRARVIGINDLGTERGIHRAYATVQVDFDINHGYDGWGWSRFDRPTIWGFIAPARTVGEETRRRVEARDEVAMLNALPPPRRPADAPSTWRTRYAPVINGSCSTDYGHDLCRFRGTVPITGDDHYLLIHLRERFR